MQEWFCTELHFYVAGILRGIALLCAGNLHEITLLEWYPSRKVKQYLPNHAWQNFFLCYTVSVFSLSRTEVPHFSANANGRMKKGREWNETLLSYSAVL